VHLYRISTLAEGKLKREKDVSLDMILGGHAGDIIHSLLTEKHKGMGRYLEQEQILFLTDKKETAAPILGMISGTPDMFWFEESTLYVEDFFLRKKVGKEKCKSTIYTYNNTGKPLFLYYRRAQLY